MPTSMCGSRTSRRTSRWAPPSAGCGRSTSGRPDQRHADDEAGATAGPVPGGHCAAEPAHVPVDDRQPEPDTRGRGAVAGEPLEDPVALVGRDTGTTVVDHHTQMITV